MWVVDMREKMRNEAGRFRENVAIQKMGTSFKTMVGRLPFAKKRLATNRLAGTWRSLLVDRRSDANAAGPLFIPEDTFSSTLPE